MPRAPAWSGNSNGYYNDFWRIRLANTKSAQKRIRSDARKNMRNTMVKSRVKTFLKKADQAISSNSDLTAEAIRQACSELDKAATKGVLHPNNAARRKSRLMARYNKANPQQA